MIPDRVAGTTLQARKDSLYLYFFAAQFGQANCAFKHAQILIEYVLPFHRTHFPRAVISVKTVGALGCHFEAGA